jgi:hypothetical protein
MRLRNRILGGPPWCLVGTVAAFVTVAATNIFVLWHFHDRYWYPVDEGIYAWSAERVLAGDVLHVQAQDFHPGYGAFLNATAFRVFGVDLVSLRYPLIAGAFLQSSFVFGLLHRRSLLLASSAAVASVALGVIHFLNPTPHWYGLFGTCALLYWLMTAPPTHWMRLVGAGFLVGAIVLFHQLVGVLVGAGVLVVALEERSGQAYGRHRLAGQLLLLLPLVGLVVYLARSPVIEFSGVLLFACWPIAILLRALKHTRIDNRDAARVVLFLSCGALLSAIPLLIYCAVHNSWYDTLHDSVFAAMSLGIRSAEAQPWYAVLSLAGLFQTVAPSRPADVANGFFWTVLPLLAAINGVFTLTSGQNRSAGMNPLPTLAAFYAVSSLYMQDAIYLFFTAGLSLTAVLWWLSERSRASKIVGATAATALAVIAVLFHAGQPSTRGNMELLRGVNVLSGVWAQPLNRATLRLDQVEQFPYAALVNAIRSSVGAGAAIFAVPNDAELYFLAERRNPFRFYNIGLAIQSNGDLAGVLERLRTDPPAVVTFRPADQYNAWSSSAVMEYVRKHYDRVDVIGGVEIYRLKTT